MSGGPSVIRRPFFEKSNTELTSSHSSSEHASEIAEAVEDATGGALDVNLSGGLPTICHLCSGPFWVTSMSCQRENCQSVGLVPIILINSHLSARKESFCIIKGNFHRHFLLERIMVTGHGME